MARSPAVDTEALDHPLLTTMGLWVEAHAGMGQILEQQLEADSALSAQWFEVLIRLARTPDHRLRMSDLAAQTTLSASGLTRAVDRLEEAGVVERQACPTDRRSTYAVLTDAGRGELGRALPGHLDRLTEVFQSVLSPDEVASLTDLLRRLRDAVNPCAAKASEPGGLDDGSG